MDVQEASWTPRRLFGRPGSNLEAIWTSRMPFGGHLDVQEAIWRPFGRPGRHLEAAGRNAIKHVDLTVLEALLDLNFDVFSLPSRLKRSQKRRKT